MHEMGGGAFLVHKTRQGTVQVFFANYADQQLYMQTLGSDEAWSAPSRVAEYGGRSLRCADMVYDELRNRLVTVMEEHTYVQVVL